MANSRPKSSNLSDPAKALAKKLWNHERRIRTLELHPDSAGFEPVGVCIYDALWNDASPTAQRTWRAGENIDVDEDTGLAFIDIEAGDALPPYDEQWFPYVLYDDGFGYVDTGHLVTPSAGVYSAHACHVFTPGRVQSISLAIQAEDGTEIATTQHLALRLLDDLPNYMPIEASGIARLSADVRLRMHLSVTLVVPPGWEVGDIVFQLWLVGTPYPPPIETPLYSGPNNGGRFTIQKVGDNGRSLP